MANQAVDLSKVFQAVTKELKANKASLNEADTYNHDHGNNIVEVFQTVTQAVKEKKSASPSEQLEHASQLLQNQSSGSAKVYSQSLAEAATRFQGKQITADNAMQLVAALMGSGQQAQTSAAPQDPMSGLAGSLLSGLMGGGAASEPAPQQSQSGSGLDLNDLLNAGMAFMQSQQQGSSPMESIVNALMSNSQVGSSSHRKESGALIINTILQVIGAMTKK